MMAPHKTLSKI